MKVKTDKKKCHFVIFNILGLYLYDQCFVSDMLLTEPINRDSSVLPSPEQLKRKIILKVGITQNIFNCLLYSSMFQQFSKSRIINLEQQVIFYFNENRLVSFQNCCNLSFVCSISSMLLTLWYEKEKKHYWVIISF